MLKDKKTTSKNEVKGLEMTPVKTRVSETAAQIVIDKSTIQDAIFQHSIFCQTFFPYRNLGNIQHWEQTQGNIELRVTAGAFFNKETSSWEILGVPYGTKSRLILRTRVLTRSFRRSKIPNPRNQAR